MMDLYIMNKSFEDIKIIDAYESLIWTERFRECGDFELYLPFDADLFQIIKTDYYARIKESNYVMIIEEVSVESNDNDMKIKVTGRSTECILDRRCVYGDPRTYVIPIDDPSYVPEPEDPDEEPPEVIPPIFGPDEPYDDPSRMEITTNYTYLYKFFDHAYYLYKYITQIIEYVFDWRNYNAIKIADLSTVSSLRKIGGPDHTRVIEFGKTVYNVICDICKEYGVGFKLTPDMDDTEYHKFVFSMYDGIDRSYNQNVNPYVVLSYKYEAFLNSTYIKSILNHKNKILWISNNTFDSYNWKDDEEREHYHANQFVECYRFDSLDLRQSGTEHIDLKEIVIRGDINDEVNGIKTAMRDEAKKYKEETDFTCEVKSTGMYEYGIDFFLGDVVQVKTDYGIEGRMRVIEVIHSQSEEGYNVYPTFELIEEDS